MALSQPERSETDPTVGGVAPPPSLADAQLTGPPPGAVWLTMCAWCGSLKVRGLWFDAEYTPALIHASAGPEPRLTHGICPPCFDKALDARAPGRQTVRGPSVQE